MSFLIPIAQPNPNLLARLGRLLHWTALGFAGLMLVPAYFAVTQSAPAPVQPAPARVSQADRPGALVKGPWENYAPKGGSAEAPWANDPIVYPKGQGEYEFAAAPDPAPSIQQQGLPYWFWLIAAAAFALTGRAARYLFAGE